MIDSAASPTLLFGLSVAFGLAASSVLAATYIWPRLRGLSRVEALRPLLVLHSFRFVGLSFMIPGVAGAGLPAGFAAPAAWGDLVATILALATLAALRRPFGLALAWVFNVWGTADLFYAFYAAGVNGLQAGEFGATFYIPTVFVPVLLVTHLLIFRLLVRRDVLA